MISAPERTKVAIITVLDRVDVLSFMMTRQSIMATRRKLIGFCDIEWIIEVDGAEAPPFLTRKEQEFTTVHPERIGFGAARNAAVSRTDADIIVAVNNGDEIVNLAPLVFALVDQPEFMWAAGMNLCKSTSGSLRIRYFPWFDEPVKQGMIGDLWDEAGEFPFPAPGSVALRREVVEKVGGWKSSDRSGLSAAAAILEDHDGWVTDEIVHTFTEPDEAAWPDHRDEMNSLLAEMNAGRSSLER